MKHTFGAWGSHIPKHSLERTIDFVVTGGTIADAEVDPDVLEYLRQLDKNTPMSILDFGCGVGRNAIPIAQEFPSWNIYAYDNDGMLEHMKNFSERKYNTPIDQIKNLIIYDNWDVIKTQKFDYVYATLVFQHIPPQHLITYIEDIKNIAKNLIVCGRRYNDYTFTSTWSILESTGLVPINSPYVPEGNPHDHNWYIYQL